MQSMMNGTMGSGMVRGMGLFWLLILVVFVVGSVAQVKYLFFGDKDWSDPEEHRIHDRTAANPSASETYDSRRSLDACGKTP